MADPEDPLDAAANAALALASEAAAEIEDPVDAALTLASAARKPKFGRRTSLLMRHARAMKKACSVFQLVGRVGGQSVGRLEFPVIGLLFEGIVQRKRHRDRCTRCRARGAAQSAARHPGSRCHSHR